MAGGLFITLYDEETLILYLSRGVYGFLMKPTGGIINPQSRHYQALADYACVRDGTHIFFFLKRKLVYAGQVTGNTKYAAFVLNGQDSPLGRVANATTCWDESTRSIYCPAGTGGIFSIRGKPEVGKKNQPYLVLFQDRLGLAGKCITSDELYWELGNYRYPLPSNSIQNMAFCTLTPGETNIALNLLYNSSRKRYEPDIQESISLDDEISYFSPTYGISSIADTFAQDGFVNEAHLEASVIANPELLPTIIRPQNGDVICRQVPLCPFKPFQMDRADICYYASDIQINDGTVPNLVIELKVGTASQMAVSQIERYLEWIYKITDNDALAKTVKAYVCAPSFNRNVKVTKYCSQIELVALA